jgi:2'-5' RNA ligase
MRLFVGTGMAPVMTTWLHSELRDELDREHWRMAPLAQWHVTALFIGDVDASRLEQVKEQVAMHAAQYGPLRLLNGRSACMPTGHPSMLWVRFDPHDGLSALHRSLAAGIGVAPSPFDPYIPHITLARTHAHNVPELTEQPLLPELVLSELTLYRTERSPSGSLHTALFTVPLMGTGPVARQGAAGTR